MASGDERERRVVENESIFRDVNERIQHGHVEFELEGLQDFLCECGDAACTARIRLTRDEYEALRSNPRAFAIVPGHDDPCVEDVVENRGRYAIVEKVGRGAEIAEERDPRRASPE